MGPGIHHLAVLLLLTGCGDFAPGSVWCGWSLAGTRRLAEAPEGQCWLLVTPSDMTTTPNAAHVDACDVEPGDRVYAGGALVDVWTEAGFSGGSHDASDVRAEGVDCP